MKSDSPLEEKVIQYIKYGSSYHARFASWIMTSKGESLHQKNESPFAEWVTSSCRIQLFLNDSPLHEKVNHLYFYGIRWVLIHWLFSVWIIHEKCESRSRKVWITFWCMINLFIYSSPFHLWFIFSWTIHLVMYDSPSHEWFTF